MTLKNSRKKPVFGRKSLKNGLKLVEVTGLEPTTFWSLTRRATKLRYTSITTYILYLKSVKKQTLLGGFEKNFEISYLFYNNIYNACTV